MLALLCHQMPHVVRLFKLFIYFTDLEKISSRPLRQILTQNCYHQNNKITTYQSRIRNDARNYFN